MPGNAGGFFVELDTLTIPLFALGRNLPENVENAPWTDRTGDARAGLDVGVDHDGENVDLQLFHTVDYGLWLEVIQSGRYAIIMPTLEAFADQVMGSVGASRGGG